MGKEDLLNLLKIFVTTIELPSLRILVRLVNLYHFNIEVKSDDQSEIGPTLLML